MAGIYALPENASAVDIITRSIIAHPSLFREQLIRQAEIHDNYSLLTTNEQAAQGARSSRNACLNAYDTIGDCDDEISDRERAEAICLNLGAAVIALNIACKLQCLPSHIRAHAVSTLEGN